MNEQMAEVDYLALLEQGIDDWNHWREDHPDIQPDLSRVYLLEADLDGVNFRGVNLSGACLIDTNLKKADLQGADLRGAYANRANLESANLHQADLSQANLSEAILTQADLSQANVARTDFSNADLTGACIEGWQLDGATNVADIKCAYVYLRSPAAERHPENTDFSPETLSEFIKQQRPATSSPIPGLINFGDTAALVQDLLPERLQPSTPNPPLTPVQKLQQWSLLASAGLVTVGLLGLAVAIRSRPGLRAGSQVSLASIDLESLPCNEPPPPNLSNQQPSHQYSSGVEYYGEFAGGAPVNGRGVMVFTNGDRYDGEFEDGDRNGCGTFTFANGRQYMGQFRTDQFHGVGVWQLENGDRYVGQFRNSKCEGWGTFLFTDGSSKSGTWEDGSLVGDTLSCNRLIPQSP